MIITQHNDNRRNGANLTKLFDLPVVGVVYAQTLFVPDLTIDDKARDVWYLATMHNRVYAFDAFGLGKLQ